MRLICWVRKNACSKSKVEHLLLHFLVIFYVQFLCFYLWDLLKSNYVHPKTPNIANKLFNISSTTEARKNISNQQLSLFPQNHEREKIEEPPSTLHDFFLQSISVRKLPSLLKNRSAHSTRVIYFNNSSRHLLINNESSWCDATFVFYDRDDATRIWVEIFADWSAQITP